MKSNFWTISRRIIAGFAIGLLITAGLGIFALKQMEALMQNITELNDNVVPSLVILGNISNAARNTMIAVEQIDAEMSADRVRELQKETDEQSRRIEEGAKKYDPMVISDEDSRLLGEIRKNHATFMQARDRLITAIAANQPPETQRRKEETLSAYEKLIQAIDSHLEFNVRLGQTEASKAKSIAEHGLRAVRLTLVGALVLTALLAWLISGTTNRLLRGLANSLDHGALQTAAASRQVSVASQSLSSGASEQASSVEETSASLEEMTSMIRSTSENAQKAKTLAGESHAAASAGAVNMGEMSDAMKSIDSSSAEVAKIVKDIDEIAFQTNILALNAAVEAARAGEAGAGFAVVADEVRSLAQRSAAAAKETAAKIAMAIENSRTGSTNSAKVADSLQKIAGSVSATDSLVGDIANAAREQSLGIEQINSAMTQMEKVTQSNAASAEETASAAEELSAQARSMQEMVARLRRFVGGKKEDQGHGRIESSAPSRETRRSGIPMPEDNNVRDEDSDFRNF
jgi:methyl-accepting chemotaxis protein